MERYLLAYTTWDDHECEYVEQLKSFDNKKDLMDIFAYLAQENGGKIISISKMNFYSLKVKQVEIQLNNQMKFDIKEVNE